MGSGSENKEYFNTIYGGVRPEPKDVYKELPKELQRVEGEIMINTILKSLLENGIQALTKHDAFLIPSLQLDKAESIIYSNLDNLLGKDKYNLKKKNLL